VIFVGCGYALPDLQLMMTRAGLCCPVAATPYRAYNDDNGSEHRPGKAQRHPAFFVKKLRRKIAGKKQKFPINAVT